MERGNGKNGGTPSRRKVIFRPRSKREVLRYLRKPLADTSAVIYFTEADRKPFLLDGDGGGIAAGGAFRLSDRWKLTRDKLERIYIIAAEEDYPETRAGEPEAGARGQEGKSEQEAETTAG